MKNCLILILILLIFELLSSTEISFGPRIDRGMLQNDEITEASGLTVSGWDSGVLWTHNDSGGETAIYALSVYGEHLGKYYPEGINFRDVEDIASGAGPETDEKYLYLADVGDNLGNYTVKYIYRIREPEVSGTQNPEEIDIPAEDIEVISFSYFGTDK